GVAILVRPLLVAPPSASGRFVSPGDVRFRPAALSLRMLPSPTAGVGLPPLSAAAASASRRYRPSLRLRLTRRGAHAVHPVEDLDQLRLGTSREEPARGVHHVADCRGVSGVFSHPLEGGSAGSGRLSRLATRDLPLRAAREIYRLAGHDDPDECPPLRRVTSAQLSPAPPLEVLEVVEHELLHHPE